MGPAVRADGRAGVLPADVAAVLRAPDDGGGHPRARGVVRMLRRGSGGDAVRPDEGGGARGRAELGRPPGGEPGVPGLQRPLGLPDPGVPPVPRADEGQGRAPGPLRAGELLLRPGLRVRRRPQRAGAAMARRGRQRAGPRNARGAHRRPLRAGAAAARPPGPASIPAGRAEARAFGVAGPGADRLRGPEGRGRAPPSGGLRTSSRRGSP